MRGLDCADHVVNLGRQGARSFEPGNKCIELCARRQFAPEQQITGFLDGRLLGQLVDRGAPITQFSIAPVDVANARAIEVQAFQAAVNFDFCGGLIHWESSSGAGILTAGFPCPGWSVKARRRETLRWKFNSCAAMNPLVRPASWI